MNRLRAAIGLLLLCALALSAIAAPSASAETKTTTAFTCVKKAEPGGAGFSKEHCSAADAVSSGAKYEHVEIGPGIWHEFDATNEKVSAETTGSAAAILDATPIGGITFTVVAKKVTATGEVENFEDAKSKAMDVKERKVIFEFTELTLSGAFHTAEHCEVEGTSVTTAPLSGTSVVNGMEVEYKPESGETIAAIGLEGCTSEELNQAVVPFTGSFRAVPDGATVETTAASSAGLSSGGHAASLTSRLTPRLRTGASLENPLGQTTVVDP